MCMSLFVLYCAMVNHALLYVTVDVVERSAWIVKGKWWLKPMVIRIALLLKDYVVALELVLLDLKMIYWNSDLMY